MFVTCLAKHLTTVRVAKVMSFKMAESTTKCGNCSVSDRYLYIYTQINVSHM